MFEPLCPGGRVVFIGMPGEPIAYDVVAAQVKEARVEHVFRYAHVYPRALALMGSGKIDVKPLITDTFASATASRRSTSPPVPPRPGQGADRDAAVRISNDSPRRQAGPYPGPAPTDVRTSSSPTPRTGTWGRASARAAPSWRRTARSRRYRTRAEFLDAGDRAWSSRTSSTSCCCRPRTWRCWCDGGCSTAAWSSRPSGPTTAPMSGDAVAPSTRSERSLAYRTASISVKPGGHTADLGLYSVTFNNDLDSDWPRC